MGLVTTPIKTVMGIAIMGIAIVGVIAAVVLPLYSAKHAEDKSAAEVGNPFSASAVAAAEPTIDTAKQIALSTPAGQIVQAVVPAVKPKPRQKPEPKFETITKRVCEPRTVTVEVDIPDAVKPVERSSIGMLLGGAAGALLGNQVGGGTGRTLATVAGAAGGAYAGDRMANSSEQARPGTHKEQRTSTVEVCHDEQTRVRVN